MKKKILLVFLLALTILLYTGCNKCECDKCEACPNCEIEECAECEKCTECEVCNECLECEECQKCEECICDDLSIIGVFSANIGDELKFTSNKEGALFSSSNPEILDVKENGEATCLKSGEVYVIATLNEKSAKALVKIDEEAKELKLGIDLIDKYLYLFEGKRVGLITNQSGVNSDYKYTIDVLNEKVNLVSLFAPEHGIRGNSAEGATISDTFDSRTNLPIYSLYSGNQKPTEKQMEELDVLCFDIQDVGARFYTYIYTMSRAMEAAKQYNKKFIVFDRPNPISASEVEGNILNMKYSSGIGLYPIVQRHGMTVGELAMMFNTEYNINCDLTVIKMENYDRSAYLDETSAPWVNPSPNMPTVETAVVYPGTCIFEGTNLSVARGTTKPFQWIGGPYVDGEKWADILNSLDLPGVYFRPVWFTPTTSTNSGKLCSGVEVHVIDRAVFKAVLTGWAMFFTIRNLYPSQFTIQSSTINVNTGCDYISKNTYSLDELAEILVNDTLEFLKIRNKYLIYK